MKENRGEKKNEKMKKPYHGWATVLDGQYATINDERKTIQYGINRVVSFLPRQSGNRRQNEMLKLEFDEIVLFSFFRNLLAVFSAASEN